MDRTLKFLKTVNKVGAGIGNIGKNVKAVNTYRQANNRSKKAKSETALQQPATVAQRRQTDGGKVTEGDIAMIRAAKVRAQRRKGDKSFISKTGMF